MADFVIRAGEYRPSQNLFTRQRDKGSADVPAFHYEGPHGPLEGYYLPGLTATEVRGPGLEPVRLEWGEGAMVGRWKRRLAEGLPCRVAGVDLTFRQQASGFRRHQRQIEVEGGGRRYVARVRGAATAAIERGDGSPLARMPTVRKGGKGWLDDDADVVDVVVVVLLEGTGLAQESAIGWLP